MKPSTSFFLPKKTLLLNSIVIGLLLGQILQGMGQSEANNHLGIQAGWTNIHLYDQHTSPLEYRAHALDIGLLYQGSSFPLFEVSLNFRMGTNQSKKHGKRVAILQETPDIYGNVSEYEIAVNPFLSMLKADLQMSVRWELNQHHSIGASFQGKHILAALGADSWHFTQVDIAPVYQVQYPIGKDKVHGRFRIPLLAGIVRPNFARDASLPDEINYWKGYLRTNATITSIHQVFNPSAQIGFQKALTNGNTAGINYSLSLLTYPLPRPVKMLEQGLHFQYFFN